MADPTPAKPVGTRAIGTPVAPETPARPAPAPAPAPAAAAPTATTPAGRARTNIAGLDIARFDALMNRPLPNPIPKDAVLVVGADWCDDTQHSLHDNGYPERMPDGRPIIYLNDANPDHHRLLRTIPNADKVLGPAVLADIAPDKRAERYNYPTFVEIREGRAERIILGDRLPPNGIANVAMAGLQWEFNNRFKQTLQYDETKYAQRLDTATLPATLTGQERFVIVNSKCGHCRDLLARNGYAERDEAGNPVFYVDINRPEGLAYLENTLKTPLAAVGGTPRLLAPDASGKLIVTPGDVLPLLHPQLARQEHDAKMKLQQDLLAEETARREARGEPPLDMTRPAAPATPSTATPATATPPGTAETTTPAAAPTTRATPMAPERVAYLSATAADSRTILNNLGDKRIQDAMADLDGVAGFSINDVYAFQLRLQDADRVKAIAGVLQASGTTTTPPGAAPITGADEPTAGTARATPPVTTRTAEI